MIVEMSKRRVIEILKKEKLTHGTFGWSKKDHRGALASSRACVMCAVGQVVRGAMAADATIDDVLTSSCRGPDGILWDMLSSTFELGGESSYLSTDRGPGRKASIAYVREHFPAKVRIDICDAKPRRGMKVVSR